MEKITCNLQNCYGIKELHHEFDFAETNAICVYARNGLMKTSFSKTFKKLQDGKISDVKDEIFDLNGVVDVEADGVALSKDNVFVIKSFESFYESNSISSLLVDDTIKVRISNVLKLKDKFLKNLEKMSGLKVAKTSMGKKVYELEPQIVKDFGFDEDSFLLNISALNEMTIDYFCAAIKYNSIFDDSVIKKIISTEFQEKIEEFCKKSDEIYSEFEFLEKGNFTLPKLKNITKSLENDSFFVKNNHLFLDGGFEIKESQELKAKIKEIEDKIKMVPVFSEIEKMLSDAKGLILKDVIENNPEIIRYLKKEKLDILRVQLWLSYIQSEGNAFGELLTEYHKLESEISAINLDDTPWKNALNIFEKRFTVPYKMEISNMKGSIIGESIPRIQFSFKRDQIVVKMDRSELENIDVLSQGEKRALYLLNIIFDIERIKSTGKEMLFIIDDIADSFDYKNKYAIVEYLREMSTNPNFRLIILSHNFDFYRTVSMRLGLNRRDRLSAERVGNSIELKEEKYQDKPFIAWKNNLILKNTVALIPFVRNLIEYGEDKNVGGIAGIDSDYLLLTHLLHEKNNTNNITFDTLKKLYKAYLGTERFKNITLSDKVMDKIYDVADAISDQDVDLENKIILAIAIRHKAEVFMLEEIDNYSGTITWKVRHNIVSGTNNDFKLVLEQCSNQTRELYNAYSQFGNYEKVKMLDEVNIMTPENIHLNSFMYEPILDMDINELLNLYQRVKSL